jgi:hypothetical protein
MRSLWPIEREVLEITAREYPASADVLRLQIDNAQVVRFENSGAGVFCYLKVATEAPFLKEKSPLNGAYGNVLGVEHGMGFIVFLESGRLSFIEGYCNGNVSTVGFDFENATFNLKPWSSKS